MKLIRADFENFRLLRRLRLDFAVEDGKAFTVIRAENETGKTTILTALQWAFYGDEALPGGGRDYRIHPIDWDPTQGNRVPIMVEVEFETQTLRRGRQGATVVKRRYRIVRSAEETVDGARFTRTRPTVRLFEITDTGDEPVDPPNAEVNQELPRDLRDIFFTDGDRALRFIEATVRATVKRERVQRAVRSLLGLGVIESALKHIKKAAADINRAARGIDSDRKFTDVMTRVESIEEDVGQCQEELEDARQQFARVDEALAENQRKIDGALVKGNREDLKREIDRVRRQLEAVQNQRKVAAKEHAGLFRSLALSRDLLAPLLVEAFARLNELHDRGKIPNATIPVLEERLAGIACICGESLEEGNADGRRRREHILGLIERSRAADELQEIVTELYYGSASLRPDRVPEAGRWRAQYLAVAERREELELLAAEHGRAQRALEARLAEVRDSGIQELRSTQREYMEQRDRLQSTQSRCETRLEGLRTEQRVLYRQRDNLLREREKGALVLAQLEVTQDVEGVLTSAHRRMVEEELVKVSEAMNAVFLEMIGSDPEQHAIIREAKISTDFDIVVSGPNGRLLDPDRDLNGASRRALTMAFILALTKVSEVEAPNVIDTPLGMMSGYVKKSVLRKAVAESAQLILFLTRAEIADCEEIIDRRAGRVITLTNTAHYPLMLANDPGVAESMVLRCECDHRGECEQCQRVAEDAGRASGMRRHAIQ